MVSPALPGLRAVSAGDGYLIEVATPDGTVIDSCPTPHQMGTSCSHWQRLAQVAIDLALPVGGWHRGAQISETLAAAAETWPDLPCVTAREVYDLMVQAEVAAVLGVAPRLTVVAGEPEDQVGIELVLSGGCWRIDRVGPGTRPPGVYIHRWGTDLPLRDPRLA